jgi:DivIVA domain-containing protein
MAISFSRPDPSSPAAVSAANFTMARRGFEPEEVREFLRMVAAELARLQEREKFLERELRSAQRQGPSPAVALDEDVVTRLLGEEAARILTTSREAAAQIKSRAEEGASRLLREATDEAQRVREEAEIEAARRRQDTASDTEAELQMAKQQGREMVNEARAYRERVLGELARRRELARQQIESLVHGRDRLLQAFERARIAAVDVMAELTPLTEPQEYVNLAPTTGPVPLIVPASEMPPTRPSLPAVVEDTPAAEEPAVVEKAAVEEVVVEEVVVEEVVVEEVPAAVGEVVAEEVPPAPEPRPAPRSRRETVVSMPEPAAGDAAATADTGRIAPVVSLFAGEADVPARAQLPAPPSAPPLVEPELAEQSEPEPDPEPEPEPAPEVRSTVDDLFARLRAARAGGVAERARGGHRASPEANDIVAVVEPPATPDSVFRASAPDPTAEAAAAEALDGPGEQTPFSRRDAELTPLIVAAARKLKRLLADEQNDVLLALRRKAPVTDLDALLPAAGEHSARYGKAIRDELVQAALAGAASLDDGAAVDHQRAIDGLDALRPALELLATTVVEALRDRLDRAIVTAAGDNTELADAARAVYREWKTQRIDEHLDDVLRTAFGRGAYVVLAPGAPVCWTVDPHGPPCPDAEDNTLGGVIKAGDPFPTDHVCAPAHEGCRCMLQRAPL